MHYITRDEPTNQSAAEAMDKPLAVPNCSVLLKWNCMLMGPSFCYSYFECRYFINELNISVKKWFTVLAAPLCCSLRYQPSK